LGDTKREATAPEVKGLRDENDRLKLALAEMVLESSSAFFTFPVSANSVSAQRPNFLESRPVRIVSIACRAAGGRLFT
jgi:hypothetical protein